MKIKSLLLTLIFFLTCMCNAQVGPGSNWYFGQNCGITFTTNPPTAVSGGALSTQEGCSTISDNAGNLLFYTDGSTVYTKNHQVMANGTGLNGNASTAQSGVIVQQPNNPGIYYVFTMGVSNVGNLCYSIVDMSLAAGMGSVTVKNTYVYGPCLEKLTAVKHSNNSDIWVVLHENGPSTNYRAYQLTSVGLNTTAVISNCGGQANAQSVGYLKFSPDGMKLASAYYGGAICELYDFNRTTGAITNAIPLTTPTSGNYGVEFSPDGTKLYCSSSQNRISQWSICAGSATAIAATLYTTAATFNWAMQLAPDGKIYVSRFTTGALGVIHNPNVAGSGCNYVDQSFTVTGQARLGLPNYVTSWFIPPPAQFTTTIGTPSNGIGCMTASFTAPSTLSLSLPGCAGLTTSLSSMMWNFGDPNSGANNTTTVSNPLHQFSALSTYTVSLILYYSNNGGSDTLKQVVNITQPCISVSSTSITCANLGTATVTALGGIGPFTYTWNPSNQVGTTASSLSPGIYTVSVHDQGNNYTYTATATFVSPVPLGATLNNSSSIPCNGVGTGTASYTNITGGSGNQNFLWSNGVNSYTTQYVSTLSAGLWSATVTDALTGCTVNNVFLILQPPAQTLNLAAGSPSACAGGSISLSSSHSGGTPGLLTPYTYSWTAGPNTATRVVSQNLAGSYVYTLQGRDSLQCLVTQTIQVDFVPNPTLSISNVSICPLQTGTLSVSGASTYVWNTATTGSLFTASPAATTQYTVTGSALGCSSSTVANIVLKSVPVPQLSSNSPVCQTQSLSLSGSGGASYLWTGPSSFTANQATAVIYNANPSHSGVYQLTVTAANTCTAATSATLTVHPTPTVSATGATLCVNQAANLTASSFTGASFVWNGPLSFVSTSQNPLLSNPVVNASGGYTVKVTSAAGCSNSAVAQVSVVALPVILPLNDGPKCFGQTLNLNGSNSTGGVSFVWNGPNGFTAAAANALISNVSLAAGGVYTLQVSTGPCVATNTTAVIVHPLPSPTITGNSPVCETKSLVLAVNAASISTINWMGPAAFTAYTQQTGRDSSGTSFAGTYTVMVTDVHNCVNTAQYSVVVLPNPTVSATGTTVCLFEPATLSAKGAVNYYWSLLGVPVSTLANALIPTATSSLPVIYSVMGTAANGCTATAKATLNTLPLPTPSLSVEPKNRLCLNEVLTFNGFGGENYVWRTPANGSFSGQTATLAITSKAYEGTYTLTVTDQKGCRASTYTSVTVNSLPSGSTDGSKTEGCVPFSSDFSFRASPSNAAPINTVKWVMLNNSAVQNSFSAKFVLPGTYPLLVYISDTNGCANTLSLQVKAYEQPKADFSFLPQHPIENTDEVHFDYTGTSVNLYDWYIRLQDRTGTMKGKSAYYLFDKAGTYPVVLLVKTAQGCVDTVIKSISVLEDFAVYVPNAFTPNKDGTNEHFVPVCRGMNTYNLVIYNRWGEKVFEGDASGTGWDGTSKGKDCKQDVYTYKLEVQSQGGDTRQYMGSVTLYR